MPRRCAGGQGINVTRAARILGGESIAVTLIGGTTGDELLQLLDAEGIDV
ncbi:MAG: 1-phosphofructokinase, partial [Candidatus Cloacimonetes bacterium]|nr:1-phosphofructokinase [Candidatus Cloacimonadota bacterium]